jgi:anti-sigma regulatory factor (Ser/Thr protein kinase)
MSVSVDRSRLQLSLSADPVSVRLTREAVTNWFREQGVPDRGRATAIALATSEAVANVVRHAYGASNGRLELDARVTDDDEVLVVVSDHGRGLAARTESPRTGLGLPVIGRVANGVTIASDAHGTSITMRFALPRRAPSGARFRRRAYERQPVALL